MQIIDAHHHLRRIGHPPWLAGLVAPPGSQNYPIPPNVDVTRFAGVTIWCDRFHVSFGAAAVNATV